MRKMTVCGLKLAFSRKKQLTSWNSIQMYSFYSNIIRVTYFCVLFGEKVDKRKSSMCSRLRQLLRKPKCFDFSESATKK